MAESKGGIRERAVARAGEALYLEPKTIKIEPGYNVRDFGTPKMKQRVSDMARSLAENGQREAIKVRLDKKTDEIFLVSGETRLRGMLEAMKNGATFKGIKAVIDDTKGSEDDRIAALILDNDQKNLEPLEQAEVLNRLRKRGYNDSEIARKTGLSQPYTSSLLGLYNNAPPEVKKLITEGKVSATTATQVLKDHPDKALEILSDAVAEAGMNGKGGRATARVIEAIKEKKKIGAKPTPSAPLWTQRSMVKSFVTALCEIALDTSQGLKPTQGTRGIARDVLENADVSPRDWMAEYGTQEEA